jgi:hypothetical protein
VTEHDLSDLSDLWMSVGPDRADEYRVEVRRECPAGHPLHGVDVEPLTIRVLLKELVCWVPAQRVWAWVHLTGTVETDPRWPATRLFPDWDALIEALREADRG